MPLAEQITRLEIPPDRSFPDISSNLFAPIGTQGLRVRLNVVADDEAGLQSSQLRSALWDNVIVHTL